MASITKQPKELQERHKRMLAELLRQPDNQECADCRARNPTWASTNLGVFVCIRCSGLHRQVGVHITKMKSTTMDLWDPEQIAFMAKMGNRRGKEIYEGLLPPDYGKPAETEDSQLVLQWIRAKYEKRKYEKVGGATETKVLQPRAVAAPTPAVAKANGVSPAAVPPPAPISVTSPAGAVDPAAGASSFATGGAFGAPFNAFMSPTSMSPSGPLSPRGGFGGPTEAAPALPPGGSAFSFLAASSGPGSEVAPATGGVVGAAAGVPSLELGSSAFGFIVTPSTTPAITSPFVSGISFGAGAVGTQQSVVTPPAALPPPLAVPPQQPPTIEALLSFGAPAPVTATSRAQSSVVFDPFEEPPVFGSLPRTAQSSPHPTVAASSAGAFIGGSQLQPGGFVGLYGSPMPEQGFIAPPMQPQFAPLSPPVPFAGATSSGGSAFAFV